MARLPDLTPRQHRYIDLLEELRDGNEEEDIAGMSQEEIAEAVGISQTMVSAVLGARKKPEEDTIYKAQTRLKIRDEYFSAARGVSHRPFVGAAATRTERESEKGVPGVEAYLAELKEDGIKVDALHAKKLRAARFYGGDASRDEIEGLHRGMVRKDKKKKSG